jgi:hypothetical protein
VIDGKPIHNKLKSLKIGKRRFEMKGKNMIIGLVMAVFMTLAAAAPLRASSPLH